MGNLMEITLNLYITLGSMDILIIFFQFNSMGYESSWISFINIL